LIAWESQVKLHGAHKDQKQVRQQVCIGEARAHVTTAKVKLHEVQKGKDKEQASVVDREQTSVLVRQPRCARQDKDHGKWHNQYSSVL
jgi:hypothetical protein